MPEPAHDQNTGGGGRLGGPGGAELTGAMPGGGGGGMPMGATGGTGGLGGDAIEPNPPAPGVLAAVGMELTGRACGTAPAAASRALALRSLSLPASMIPESVPVRNVAMGMINSKNFWSMGLMALSGCVTNMIEYSTTNTMPTKVSARQMPMKNLSRAMSCSSVYTKGSVAVSGLVGDLILSRILIYILLLVLFVPQQVWLRAVDLWACPGVGLAGL